MESNVILTHCRSDRCTGRHDNMLQQLIVRELTMHYVAMISSAAVVTQL